MIKVVAILKAKPGQTAEELRKRWVEQHALIGAGFKNLKAYRISLPVAEYHKKKGEGIAFDGTAEMYWDSYEDMIEDQTSERGRAAGADGDLFVDACLNLYCEEFVIVAPKKD